VRTELILKFELTASHSLSAREEPHPHVWRIEAVVSGEPQNGFIINLPELRDAFERIIAPLRQTFLNDNPSLDASAQKTPTCETLAQFFYAKFNATIRNQFAQQNPTARTTSVQVAICEPNGFEWGAARLCE
jgi:6-pyruvoyl-tetrahydropterin synthase